MKKVSSDDFTKEIELAATAAAPLFNMYGWTYGDNERPTLRRLEEMIRDLVDRAIVEKSTIASGRFIVSYNKYDGEVAMNISLDLADMSIPIW